MNPYEVCATFRAGLAAFATGHPFDDSRLIAWQAGWCFAQGGHAALRGKPISDYCPAHCHQCTSWRQGWIDFHMRRSESHAEAPHRAHSEPAPLHH